MAGNARGASVRFGPEEAEGSFTPGELLAVALAACNLMSADATISRRLGDDVEVSAAVETLKDRDTNSYVDASVQLRVTGAEDLDGEAWRELVAVASRAVERACTVGRTLEAGLPHTLTVVRD